MRNRVCFWKIIRYSQYYEYFVLELLLVLTSYLPAINKLSIWHKNSARSHGFFENVPYILQGLCHRITFLGR